MKRFYMWIVICAIVALITIVSWSHRVIAAVKSASTDGEATVYVMGKFSEAFDVAYRGRLNPGARNKSSGTTLSILLIGQDVPGPGVSIGLAGDPSHMHTVHPFTYAVYPNAQSDYRSYSENCMKSCVIELRGDRTTIYALLNGKNVGSWSRSDLYFHKPYIQLNAESHGVGDSILASFSPIRAILAGNALPRPTCAFTTRGIEPSGHSTITFYGTTSDAGAAFVNLHTGAHGSKC